jgi:hypothetical protein
MGNLENGIAAAVANEHNIAKQQVVVLTELVKQTSAYLLFLKDHGEFDFVTDKNVMCIRENWRFGFGPKIELNSIVGYDFGSVCCNGDIVESLEYRSNLDVLLQYFDTIVAMCAVIRQKTEMTLTKIRQKQARQKMSLMEASQQSPLRLS